jgi:hypothetical protein
MTWLRRILKYAVGVLFAIFMLEFCARLDDYSSYGAPMWGPYDTEIMYVRDKIGRKGKPGARYKKWQLNSLGFRGPELQPGRVRIVCMGSSETFGLYEAPGEEYPRQLERELNAWAGRNLFEVVNVAHPGETVRTQILRVPETVEEVRPQIALIYPSPAQYIWLPWLKLDPAAPTATTSRPHLEWRIASNLRELAKRLLPKAVQDYLSEREIRREVAVYGMVMDRVPEENIIQFHNDLEKLVKTLRDAGVEPVLVTHAMRFGPVLSVSSNSERHVLVSWRKFFPMLKEDGFLDMEWRMNGAIRQLATEQHLTLIDAAREISPGKQNFADFSHFTTAGAHLMAVHLAGELEPLLRRYATGGTATASR